MPLSREDKSKSLGMNKNPLAAGPKDQGSERGNHMRRNDKEIRERERLEEILHQAPVCRVSMCAGNIPYLVPLSFGYSEGVLYFHAAKDGKKINILRENPVVCFEVETGVEIKTGEKACNWSVNYWSVIGMGRAAFIEEEEQKIEALNMIMKKYAGPGEFEYPAASLAKVLVFKIVIETMTGKKSGY